MTPKLKTLLIITVALLLGSGFVSFIDGKRPVAITSQELMDHVKFLADDDLKGRLPGTEGILEAGEYIAEEFRRLGLKPVGHDKTYFQNFSLPRGFEAKPDTSCIAIKSRRQVKFKFKKEIHPLPSSRAGEAEGQAVFAGYGISAPDLEYDDYKDIDASGKIVIVLRGVPNTKSKKSPFKNSRAVRRYASFKAKQDTAAGMGAKGLIVVNDPVNFGSKSKDILTTTGSDNQGTIPALHMTYRAAKRMVSDTGLSLSSQQKQIDSRSKPKSKELTKLSLKINASLEIKTLKVRNIVGLLESKANDRKDEVIVVGAHFDHIGLGEYGSLGGSKAKGKVHNGADDNASGTAGVMEIAGYLKERENELKRNILFICFTAEEMGLLGSKHYVDSPIIPLEKTAAMINLDMISYLAKMKSLQILGVGTSPCFQKLIKESNRNYRIKTKEIKGAGRGGSDHYPFYQKSLPVLFFITGLHSNYHRPEDDWKLLDKRGFEKVVRLAGDITYSLAMLDAKPVFTPASGGSFSSGPFLGVSVETVERGVYVSDVAKGSPAQKGGLKKGDRLIEVEDKEITSISIFYGIWAQVKPGTRVTFIVRRNGRTKTIKVTLKK